MFDFKEKFKIFIKASLIAVVIFIGYNFAKDFLGGEEGRVRKFILKGKRAFEQRDIFALNALVAKGYKDKYGNDASSILYAAKTFFASYKAIGVNIGKMEIKIEDSKDRATVEMEALVVGQTEVAQEEKILEGERGKFCLRLVKEEKQWQLLELEFFQASTIMGHEI